MGITGRIVNLVEQIFCEIDIKLPLNNIILLVCMGGWLRSPLKC